MGTEEKINVIVVSWEVIMGTVGSEFKGLMSFRLGGHPLGVSEDSPCF